MAQRRQYAISKYMQENSNTAIYQSAIYKYQVRPVAGCARRLPDPALHQRDTPLRRNRAVGTSAKARPIRTPRSHESGWLYSRRTYTCGGWDTVRGAPWTVSKTFCQRHLHQSAGGVVGENGPYMSHPTLRPNLAPISQVEVDPSEAFPLSVN